MNLKGSNNQRFVKKAKALRWVVIITFVIVYSSFYIPVPYYITSPGSALDLSTVIEVKGGYKESGNLMLTTVAIGPGNVGNYIYSYFDPFMDTLPKEAIMLKDEDPKDYTKRQLENMKLSQDSAVITAYKALNLPINVHYQGVVIMGIVSGMPGEKVFKVGDIIVKVNNESINQKDELLKFLKDRKSGEKITVQFIRNEKRLTKEIVLSSIKQQNSDQGDNRVGIGIYPIDKRMVIPTQPVIFHTEDIGGPSAGLMFTLEIINQLLKEDITKGYQIAGTGEITTDGQVGQIGGAKLKVKAAYKKGAEIFFVPKDINASDKNQKEAEKANVDLGRPLKIVPVANVQDALNFLKSLPPKQQKS